MSDNLITLPPGNGAEAEFSRVLSEGALLLVALGDGRREADFVDRARLMVGGNTDPAIVVWAKEPFRVQGLLAGLDNPEGLDVQGSAAVACSISLPKGPNDRRQIADVISQQEEPSFFRILRALATAAGL